ncbi:MAG: rhamnan synthesis F family protein [Pseudomonadota bacterium]
MLPEALLSFLFAKPYYDLILSKKRRTFHGKVEQKDRIAIYLFYPKKGLLKSHQRSIEYLQRAGYAPLLVCNATLNEADRQTVLNHCWRYIERPNFGYDFGGYRDGILSIRSELRSLDRLLLTNDSTWFPLPKAMDWIAESEALNVDYAAAAWAWAVKAKDPKDFEDIQWQVDKNRRNFHYASYALNISSAILATDDFFKFWKRFRLSNDKKRTVRRGEIGLTHWVIRNGFSHGATTEMLELDRLLSTKTDEELAEIIRNLIFVTDPVMKSIAQTFLTAHGTSETQHKAFPRKTAERLIANAVARQGMSYSIMSELIKNHDFAFMKKSPAFFKDGTENVVKNILEESDADFQNDIMHEISMGK